MRDRILKALLRAFGFLHARFFRATGGHFAAGIGRIAFLLLITRGHKSGLERVTPLLHARLDGAYIIAASYAGTAEHPAWYLNLRGQSEAFVEVKAARERVQVVELEGEDRERAWQALLSVWPFFAGYRKRAPREIPVFALTPLAADGRKRE